MCLNILASIIYNHTTCLSSVCLCFYALLAFEHFVVHYVSEPYFSVTIIIIFLCRHCVLALILKSSRSSLPLRGYGSQCCYCCLHIYTKAVITNTHTHTHTHARARARTHARTHVRACVRQTYTHTSRIRI